MGEARQQSQILGAPPQPRRAAPRRAAAPPHCPLPRAAPPYASLAPRHSTASAPGPAQMEAVRSKVPVLVSSTSTGSEDAAVAERV